jgi:RNA polymerase sigma factor (TIGR02999 family)
VYCGKTSRFRRQSAAISDMPLGVATFGNLVLMANATQILSQIEQGNAQAAEHLLPLVYDELRQLAAAKLRHEQPGQTLQATALVHEAYLRLVDDEKARHWDSRAHFFAAAAEAIRRILIEKARRKARVKHGGGRLQIQLNDVAGNGQPRPEELLALDEALEELAATEPAKAELVKLRYFGGFSVEEAADLLQISRTTANRYWAYSRAWLLAKVKDSEE